MGLAVLAYGAFATADAVIKVASDRFAVPQIAMLMAFFALLPVVALTHGQGGLRALRPKNTRLVLARAVLTAACCHLAWNAFTMLPLAEAYAVLFASPMIVTALSAIVLGEDVGWRRWSATIMGFTGVLVMLDPSFETLGFGHLLAGGAAIAGSASFLILRKIGGSEKSAAILATLFLAIALASAPGALRAWVTPTVSELALIATAGLLLGSGQAGLVLATREVPAVLVAPFQYTQMIWAVLFGIWLFGDPPTSNLLLGLGIVVSSGLFIIWRETVRARPVTLAAGRGEVTARAAR